MEHSDEDLIDFGSGDSNKNRPRTLERIGTQLPSNEIELEGFRGAPPSLRRSATTPVAPTINRPQLSQFTSTSGEFIQKTRTGLLDFTEKGKATLQQAGSSVSGFRERMLQRENSWNSLLRPSESSEGKRNSTRVAHDGSGDDESEENSPAASLKPQPEAQLNDTDRKEASEKILTCVDLRLIIRRLKTSYRLTLRVSRLCQNLHSVQ